MQVHVSNYSGGWIIEKFDKERCSSWLLIPGENLWSNELRGFLYLFAMLYIFLGIAIVSDIFMCSIEVITSKRKKVFRWDEENQEMLEKEVLIWNETVANLTLMALGSSAPEIMLSVVVTGMNLGRPGGSDDLGTFTIIGSAAFNLLLITAVCIVSVPSPDTKRIRELGVFMVTSIWSIFAYLWMLVVLIGFSPGVIEVWEAWVTFAFFPVMVLTAYCQDNHWWCRKKSAVAPHDLGSHTNIRVVGRRRSSIIQGLPKELTSIEKERARSLSRRSVRDEDRESVMIQDMYNNSRAGSPMSPSLPMNNNVKKTKPVFARARFRHAAMKSMMGRRTSKFTDVHKALGDNTINTPIEDFTEKFTFESPKYSVREGTGDLTVEVLFHRNNHHPLAPNNEHNGSAIPHENGFTKNNKETTGVVSVEFETREGSAKFGHNFEYMQGKLIFGETEDRKSITIPIVDNNQFDDDTEFYIILRNPLGGRGLGDPSVATVTIIDDDVPGVFQFDDPHCYANLSTGLIQAQVVRTKGCDGEVHVEYSTIDGSARGGPKIADDVDYVTAKGDLAFDHGEVSKTIAIEINKESKDKRTFVLTLKNPTSGAKIGSIGAAVCTISSNDDLANRLAGILDDDDDQPETWGGQFRSAVVLEQERDEDGEIIPLKWYHYWLHFLTIFWKLLFALIPPRNFLGAYPSFIGSLIFIGLITCVLEQLGSLLGCVVGLEASVAGITVIAIGTSLPDTFASRTAALHDQGADAAIGNVTGSNSVNVFLGLGLPWIISSMYHLVKNTEFTVETNNLVSSIVIFATVGTVALLFLVFRRHTVGGELGGQSKLVKWGSAAFLLLLWVIYVTLASLKAYNVTLPW